jgi:hypothetical protein
MTTFKNRSVFAISPAKVIAMITDPCLLSIAMLLLITFSKSSGSGTAILVSISLLIILVILPLTYVYFRLRSQPDKGFYRRNPTLFLKRHPRDILILAIVLGPSLWAILKYLSAPVQMLDALLALLGIAFLIAIINIFYRASFHLAAIATLIYLGVIIWGPMLLILILLIPVIAWAKFKLGDHTILQMVLGVILAVATTSLYWYWR